MVEAGFVSTVNSLQKGKAPSTMFKIRTSAGVIMSSGLVHCVTLVSGL